MRIPFLAAGALAAVTLFASEASAQAPRLITSDFAPEQARLVFGLDTANDQPLLEQAQFFWSGRHYCWYPGGWQGPGFYWCGYAWRRGLGWGGGDGWHGWRGHGGGGYGGGHGGRGGDGRMGGGRGEGGGHEGGGGHPGGGHPGGGGHGGGEHGGGHEH